ncbi:hypothetical protein [Halocatena marina]|uniref:Uncharacterized protein n=1 Tax=Halocatena marina TaxID=2934937 RepID=A0ABD5YYQ2_9EURY|nr:hypothetical protein [Halocatena marina]
MGFLSHLCSEIRKLRIVFSATSAAAVLMLLWFPFVEPGTATYAIVVLNLGLSIVLTAVNGSAIWACKQWRKKRTDEVVSSDN